MSVYRGSHEGSSWKIIFVIPDFEKARDSNVYKSFLLQEPMTKFRD